MPAVPAVLMSARELMPAVPVVLHCPHTGSVLQGSGKHQSECVSHLCHSANSHHAAVGAAVRAGQALALGIAC